MDEMKGYDILIKLSIIVKTTVCTLCGQPNFLCGIYSVLESPIHTLLYRYVHTDN